MSNNCDKKKPERNQIWVYEKKCNNTLNIPDNSYVGKIGFAYYLVNNDKKEKTEYKVNYKFTNSVLGELHYYVSLYKVTKVKFNKKTNTTKKYLECVRQYSYKTKLDQRIVTDIINKIGNDNYDLIPNDSNEFNDIVIKNILKTNKNTKNGSTSPLTVQINQVGKMYGLQGCYARCYPIGGVNCGGGNGECKICQYNGGNGECV
jgi:hypothetical protein